MKRTFLIITTLFLAIFLSACAPKINPIDALPETTWQPIYVKGAKGLKKPIDAQIHFEKNLELEIFGGVQYKKASVKLTRKKLRRCQCALNIELKPVAKIHPIDAQAEKDFSEFQNLFIERLTSADAIRLNANKLEFLKGKKVFAEFKRIPNYLGKKKEK